MLKLLLDVGVRYLIVQMFQSAVFFVGWAVLVG